MTSGYSSLSSFLSFHFSVPVSFPHPSFLTVSSIPVYLSFTNSFNSSRGLQLFLMQCKLFLFFYAHNMGKINRKPSASTHSSNSEKGLGHLYIYHIKSQIPSKFFFPVLIFFYIPVRRERMLEVLGRHAFILFFFFFLHFIRNFYQFL